jgi:class 3 adenylate cyclase
LVAITRPHAVQRFSAKNVEVASDQALAGRGWNSQMSFWSRAVMPSVKEDRNLRSRGRMDFTMEVIRTDDDTRTVQVTVVPDARRYEIVERDGEKFYLDKYLRHIFSVEEMNSSMARQMPGLPIFALSPTIKSTPEYAVKRRAALLSDVSTGEYTPPVERAVPHRRFEEDSTSREVAFLSVDICGSSAQRRADPEGFDHAYAIMLRELGTVVGQFNGTLLKPTGDGFIAVVDHPSFTSLCDAAVDMGLSLLVVLRGSVNPALEQAGHEPLKIRVGADYGRVQIRQLKVPATGFSQPEVASDALNRAVKIEQSCEENEFRIGRRLYELIHVTWLERAQEVTFDGASVGISDYRIYRMQ